MENAYYAFDTEADLEILKANNTNFKYDANTRELGENSMTLTPEEVTQRLANGEHYVIRNKITCRRE